MKTVDGDRPKVAVMYTTYNNFLPNCVEATEKAVEYPVDFWILSDTTNSEAIATERRFQEWRHYNWDVARGDKCGIIND